MESNLKNNFFSIGKVASMVEVAAHTIRFWQKQFPQITPKIGKGKRKYYNLEAINQFKNIKTLMYEKGMKIAGIQKIMLSEATDKYMQYTLMPVTEKANNSLPDLLSWSQIDMNKIDNNYVQEKMSSILIDIEKVKQLLEKIK